MSIVNLVLAYVNQRVGILFGLFFFQAEDGIRDLVRSRGLGDVYKRQDYNELIITHKLNSFFWHFYLSWQVFLKKKKNFLYMLYSICLLYTSDAADERSSVDLGGRRIIKKNKI